MRHNRCCCLILAACLVATLAILAAPALAESPVASVAAFVEVPSASPGGPLRYRSLGGETTLWLEPDALWMTMPTDDGAIETARIAIKNAPDATLEPFGPLATRLAFFIGDDPTLWRTDIQAWRGVRWRNVAPGVDLEITSQGGTPALEFIASQSLTDAAPGAAIAKIRWDIDGAVPMALLHHQHVGERGAPSSSPAATFTSPYLAWSTLIPGSGSGTTAMILPADQQPIVVGDSLAPDFPTTPGAYDREPNGSRDIWVCKLTANGDGVIWATYIGGGRHESAPGLALHPPTGDIYLAGDTASPNFPITPGAFDPDYGNLLYDSEAFCLRLAADGSALIWSTYLGGEGYDWGRDVAVDAKGRAFVVGSSNSPDLVGSPGALDPTHNGGYDAFLMALNADGASLHYGTLLGGAEDDGAGDIALDDAGNAYLLGSTRSTAFPTTPGAYSRSLHSEGSLYVAQVSADGAALAYSTLLAPSPWYFYSNQHPGDILVDDAGRAVVTGEALPAGFPTTPGAYDTTLNGSGDAFVAWISADGSALDMATLYGGSGADIGHALALDAQGAIMLCGETQSTNLPTTADRIQGAYGGGNRDGFVARLSGDGTTLTYGSWLGGEAWDIAVGLGVAWSGEVVVTGQTASEGFPTTASAWAQGLDGASGEAFVSRIIPATGGSVASTVALPIITK